MGREKEMLREQMLVIRNAFPDKELLMPGEVAKWLHKDPRTVKRDFSFKPGIGISIVQLAREMLP